MYSFNEFQVETNAYNLYNLYTEKYDAAIENLQTAFRNVFSTTKAAEKSRKLNKFATNVGYVGFGICAFTSLINGNILPLTMCTLTIFLNEYTEKLRIKNIDTSAEKAAQDIYNVILEHLGVLIENYDELDITDDQIHEMTYSLQNGEYDDKYRNLSQVGKCPVYIVSTENESFAHDCMVPITDANLSRLYEIIMHIAYNAEEGYEELVREGYHLVKNYVKYNEIKEAPKDLKEALLERIRRYESKIASRAKVMS